MTDWPETEEDNTGWTMRFKTEPPSNTHSELRQAIVFDPEPGQKFVWIWSVHVGRDGKVTVEYCNHDRAGIHKPIR